MWHSNWDENWMNSAVTTFSPLLIYLLVLSFRWIINLPMRLLYSLLQQQSLLFSLSVFLLCQNRKVLCWFISHLWDFGMLQFVCVCETFSLDTVGWDSVGGVGNVFLMLVYKLCWMMNGSMRSAWLPVSLSIVCKNNIINDFCSWFFLASTFGKCRKFFLLLIRKIII